MLAIVFSEAFKAPTDWRSDGNMKKVNWTRTSLQLMLAMGIFCATFGGCLNIWAEGFGDEGPKITPEAERMLKIASLVVPIAGCTLAIGAALAMFLSDRNQK